MEASRSGNTEIVQLLLENDANPDQTNSVRTDADMCTVAKCVFTPKHHERMVVCLCSEHFLTVSQLTGELDGTDGSSQ